MLVDSCPRLLLGSWGGTEWTGCYGWVVWAGDEGGRISTWADGTAQGRAGQDRARAAGPPKCDISISNVED